MNVETPLLWLACLSGNGLIYAGQAFVAGRLFPSLLADAYAGITPGWRVFAMTAITAVPVNALFAAAYRMAPPASAGMAALGSLVVVLCVNAVLLGAPMPPRALLAAAATLASSMWLAGEMG